MTARSTPHSERTVVSTGPYRVILDRTALQAGKNTILGVHIERDGLPAAGLRPYLGARAHAVLIGPGFEYIHAHAMSSATPRNMQMAGMSMNMNATPPDDGCGNDETAGMSLVELPPGAHVAPDMGVMLRPGRPGRYHLWLQFADRTDVYTAPFLIQVSGSLELNKPRPWKRTPSTNAMTTTTQRAAATSRSGTRTT